MYQLYSGEDNKLLNYNVVFSFMNELLEIILAIILIILVLILIFAVIGPNIGWNIKIFATNNVP